MALAVLLARVLLPVAGLVGPLLVLLGLPGTWLLLAMAGLVEWWTGPRLFSDFTLVGVIAVAVLGEVRETFSSSVWAKRAGGGRRGALGALVGGIAGAILGTIFLPTPVIGTLVGGGTGAFALATLLERSAGRAIGESLRIGRAAAASS